MSAPAPLRLRPFEVGDLLDETIRVYRRNFFLFAGISVVLVLPQALLSGYGYYSFFNTFTEQAATGGPIDVGQLEALIVGGALLLVLTLLLTPFSLGAITYATCEWALGRSVTFGQVVSAVLRRYLQLLGFALLFYGMGILFCLFPLWIWILVGWVAVIPVMYVEGLGLGQAMGRSWQLVKGRWWRTFWIVLLTLVVANVASIALGAFIRLGEILLEIFASPAAAIAITSVVSELASSLASPLLQIVIVLIYFDLRVRREALDLFQLGQRVSSPLVPS